MALSVIRPFTYSDKEGLTDSAIRFADRHSLNTELEYYYNTPLYEALDLLIAEYYPNLKPLWQACKCRALKVPLAAGITVAYGSIGYSVN